MSSPITEHRSIALASDVASVLLATSVALAAQLSPVSHAALDIVWTVVFGLVVGLSARRAPAAVLLLVALLGAIASTSGIVAAGALGALALVLAYSFGFTSGIHKRTGPIGHLSFVVSPWVMGVLVSLTDFGISGTSAVFAGFATTTLAAAAVATSPTRSKRLVVAVLPGLLAVAAFAVVSIGVEIRSVQGDLLSAQREGADLRAALSGGDLQQAQTSITVIEDRLSSAAETLDSRSMLIARATPALSQNVRSIQHATEHSERVLSRTDAFLGAVSSSPDLLTSDGIAIDATRPISAAADNVLVEVRALQVELEGPDDVWVVPQIRDGRDKLQTMIASLDLDAERRAAEGLDVGDAVLGDVLEHILGANEPQNYLVIFANPAEARDLGGFTGSTAVIRINNGSFELTAATRNGILNQQPTDSSVLGSALPFRYLEQRPWEFAQNYTGSPDLPTIATAMADIFPAVTGEEIDGVVYVDPFALDALVSLTGPIEVPGSDRTFAPGDLATFLTRTQYAANFETRGEREQLFADLGAAVFEALSRGELDASPNALRRIATVLREGRLAFSPVDAQEREFFTALGVSGTITDLRPTADYVAVSHLNAAPNKLDAYLHRSIDYAVTTVDNSLSATATITLENHAPEGLSLYASDNTRDLPTGTNRMTLVVHTPHELVSWAGVDDEPELTRSFFEYGRWRHERIVIIPRGESRTVAIELAGTAPLDTYELDIDAQPLIHADTVNVSVVETTSDGTTTKAAEFVLRHDTTITPS